MGKTYDYSILAKPKVLFAMLALYLASYFASYAYSGITLIGLDRFLLGLIAVAAAVSGANALNCYLDRDIDALMTRTLGRPLVTGAVGMTGALTFSGTLLGAAALIALYLGAVPFLLFLEGAGTYLILYTVLMKRRTSLNVFATAPSVAAPAWFGWYLGGAPLYPVGVILGALVAIWGPIHLWSLAYAYSKDYDKTSVPMFPSVVSKDSAVVGIVVALAVLIISSYALLPWTSTLFYPLCVTFINVPLAIAGYKFYMTKTNRAGWWIFKLTAPQIIVVLLAFMVEKLFLT